MKFDHSKNKHLRATVIFSKHHQGFKNIVHGGMIGLVLDELMGNLLWKTGTDINEDGSLVQGSRLLLSGSIKEHATRKDTKQTVITRCKLALDPLRAAGAAA